MFLIIFHIVFGLVEVLILLIYSCQHFFFCFVYCFASFCSLLFNFNAIFGGRFFFEFS